MVLAAGIAARSSSTDGPRVSSRLAMRIVNTDRVNLNILFVQEVRQFVLSQPAVIVAAVGDEKKNPSTILGPSHVMNGELHGIKQGRASPWFCG